MTTAGAVFVALAIVATAAAVAWMVLNRRHPENASVHGDDRQRATDHLPTEPPADAGAESQTPEPQPSRRADGIT